jgi:hypothetical protein
MESPRSAARKSAVSVPAVANSAPEVRFWPYS